MERIIPYRIEIMMMIGLDIGQILTPLMIQSHTPFGVIVDNLNGRVVIHVRIIVDRCH
jgi:hypothetical protein